MWIGIILATSMWGIAPLFEKVFTRHVSIVTMTFLFTFLNAILAPIIWLFYFKTIRTEVTSLFKYKRFVMVYAFLALVCGLSATLAYLWAVKLSKDRTYIVVALTCVYPLITALLLQIFYKETLNFYAWLGIGCIVVGVLLLSINK
jgi:uncharacterized membrane protein